MYKLKQINPFGPKRGISRGLLLQQDEERFIPPSAGNGELILLNYNQAWKG